MFDELVLAAELAFSAGVDMAHDWKSGRRKGQVSMAAIGGIMGVILVLYVALLVIGKFHPVILQNIEQTNDTIAKSMLTDVDSNTQSSLSMTSMVPFIGAIGLVLGLLFGIFR